MSKLPPASSFDDIPSIGLFCYKCKRRDFPNDSKGRRSHAQHQRRCTAGLPKKGGVKARAYHVSGTDPLPLLTKKRRVDDTDFNYAYQLDNYLDDNNHIDNFCEGNADSDVHSQQALVEHHDVQDLSDTAVYPSTLPSNCKGAPYNQNAVLPPSYQFQIELQTILDRHRIHLKVHDEIVGLLKSHFNTRDNTLPFSTDLLLTRNHFLSKLEKSLDVSKLKHKDIEVKLSSGGAASVAVYDLEAMIMSLLTDERLMKPENIAEGYDLFTGKSVVEVDHLGEIHTGAAWEPARQRFCGDDPNNMPLALVVFADKSHLDLHGTLSTLPIIFTLSCFNEQSRNSVDFWRPIAFIPNLNAGSLTSRNSNVKKKDPAISVQDEHDCLRAALSSLRNLYSRGGINATVMGRDVCCKPWIHFVVGDNSGNNRFLGHYNGSGNIKLPYRDCKCEYDKMDHPLPQCEYITLQDYLDHKAIHATLKTKGEKKVLNSDFSKHCINNAFVDDNLPLSDSVYGIFRMTPPERLHVLGEGITVYMFDCLRNIIGDKGVGKTLMNDIETVHHNLNHRLRRNSERDFPRGSDRNGCLKNTLVNASERRGNLFRLLCLCHTDQISRRLTDILKEKMVPIKDFIKCIKLYLSFEEWMHSKIPKVEIAPSRTLISETVTLIQKCFPRTDENGAVIGQGWKFPKMHGLTKFVDYMILFGSAINFFGGIGECNHKKFVKDTGCNTQKRTNTFTSQVATRYSERMTFDLANHCIKTRHDKLFGIIIGGLEKKKDVPVMEGRYVLTFEGLTAEGTFDHTKTLRRTNLPDRCVQAIALFAAKQDDYRDNYSVTGYTACKFLLDGRSEIFRAVSSFMDDGHWYDWCLVQWEDESGVYSTFPGRILGFFNLDHSGSCDNLMECIHVVVESSCKPVSMDDLSQSFIKKFNMPVDDKLGDYTYLVPLSTISHPLCVFKNYGGLNNEFFCVLPQRKWGGFFSAHIRRHINSGQTADTDDVGDSSSINLDDGVDSSSIGTLDFGDSSDDSSQSTSDERR
jgi:hypothetical protein